MLVHDDFVFLHVPKTGGRFVRQVLCREVPACQDMPAHAAHWGWDRIPAAAAGRPVLAFARNPWDWYVSWYSFLMARPTTWFARLPSTNPFLTHLLLDTGRMPSDPADATGPIAVNDFATTVRRACLGVAGLDDRPDPSRIVRGLDLEEPLIEGHDFYSARLLTVLGDGLDSGLLTVGRFEAIASDLVSFVRGAGTVLPAGAAARMRATAPVGRGRHAPYRDYYDRELRDLVGESCRELIDRFGYAF